MPIRNQQPAYNYGLSLMGNQPGPNQAGVAGGIERALQPILAALLMKEGIKQQETKDADYGKALMDYQQGVQNEMIPTGVSATPPVAMGEDPSLRDYSGVVQKASAGEAMGNALMGVKNTDVVRDLQPMIMQQQMADMGRADDRAMANSQNLQAQRFQRGTQQNQQNFAADQAEVARNFTGEQGALDRNATVAAQQAQRDFTAGQTDRTIAAQNERSAADRESRVEAARIRANVAQSAKPMPQGVQRAEDEDLDAVGLATALGGDLKAIRERIANDKLNLGPIANRVSSARNSLGMGSENSRNFADFKATLEKARNDSLRLNKGVQTDQDAIRAWNELFDNLNDEGVVTQRLKAIEGINARAAQLRAQNVDIRRTRNNQPAFDWTGFKVPESPYASQDQQQPGALPQGVTEDDIAETMRANKMTPSANKTLNWSDL